jgi:hypothetical protein
MKIKKNTFSTLVLELFFPSIANFGKLKIQKKSKKSTSSTAHYAISLMIRSVMFDLNLLGGGESAQLGKSFTKKRLIAKISKL